MRREYWISCVLLFVTLAAYWPVKDCEFLNYDDPVYVSRNPHVQTGLTRPGIHWAFTTDQTGNWHPLTWISHMADCQLHGLRPRWHHLTNLFFHAANTVLLFWVLRGMTGAFWRSALVAGLFAWHPMHVESVAWVAERKDVLSMFFGLLAIGAYGCYARRSKFQGAAFAPRLRRPEPKCKVEEPEPGRNPKSEIGNPKSKVYYVLALFFFGLGLMSKPMLVTLPFVFLLLDYWPLGRVSDFGFRISDFRCWFRLVLEKIPFLALALASCVVTYLVQQKGGNVSSLGLVPMSARLGNVPVAYVCYVAKFLWPQDLCVLYPFTERWPIESVAGALLVLLLMSMAIFFYGQKRAYLPVGWLWFVGTLVPVIGLVQVGQQFMADRYTYLPYVGLFIALSWGFGEVVTNWPGSKVAVAATVSTVLLGCIWCTHNQLAYWKDSLALFERAIAVEGENPMALWNLADALFQKGNFEDGEAQLQKVLRIAPNLAPVQAELAWGLSQEGKTAEAVKHYRTALRLNPFLPEALSNLAWILATDREPANRNGAEAAGLAERACTLTGYADPAFVSVLAAAYAEKGRYAEAVDAGNRAVQLALATGDQVSAEQNRRYLELYRANRAFHQGGF